MKIWLEYPLDLGKTAQNSDFSAVDVLCLTQKLHIYTRISKIVGLVEDAVSSEIFYPHSLSKALYFTGNDRKWLEAIRASEQLLAKDHQDFFQTLVVPSSLYSNDELDTQLDFLNEALNSAEVFVDVKQEILPRQYEGFFRKLSKLQVKGVVLHHDRFSRGDIALAHKFDLESVVTDIAFERHEDKVKKSETDAYMICGSRN